MSLTINTEVFWESQANGTEAVKSGRVVCIVPAGQWIPKEWSKKLPNHGGPRNHDSYIVEVMVGKTDRAKPKYYWPIANKLHVKKSMPAKKATK